MQFILNNLSGKHPLSTDKLHFASQLFSGISYSYLQHNINWPQKTEQPAVCVAELQVCMATRSPCEDQALPLSWAPPSSAEGGKSPQEQPCCRLQWLRLSTFSAAGRLTEFFREPRHLQMPGRSWRAGKAIAAMESPQALIAPLKRGLGGLNKASSDAGRRTAKRWPCALVRTKA